MTINLVCNVEENYPMGSNWDYNQWVQLINDNHQAPLDSYGSSYPTSSLFNGYGFFNTGDGNYYVYINSTWRFFKHNWNAMVGRGALNGRLFIKEGANNIVELRRIDNNTFTSLNTSNILSDGLIDADAINVNSLKQNELPFWASENNPQSGTYLTLGGSFLGGGFSTPTLKKNINYLTANSVPFLQVNVAGNYAINFTSILNNQTAGVRSIGASVVIGGVAKYYSYEEIAVGKWATLKINAMPIKITPADAIEIKIINGDPLGLGVYNSYLGIQCIHEYN